MPRFFFHVFDGRPVIDTEGTKLSGLDEARAHAIETAADILRQSARSLWNGCLWHMTVADANGDTVLTLRLYADEHQKRSPARMTKTKPGFAAETNGGDKA